VPPQADRKPTTWVFAQLSERMGVPLMNNAELAAQLPDDFTDDDVLAVLAASSRVLWEQVREAPHGVMAEHAPGPGWLIPDNLPRPLDLAPAPIVEQLAHWEQHLPRADELVLVNRRLVRQMNSTMRDVGRQAQLAPHPTLLVHPDDAATYGITDGDHVVIESRHGSTHATAEVTETIRRGVVSVPHGWAGPNVNALTSDLEDCDPLTGMPRYSGFPVRVRNAAAASA
jgi:anaerobic selenocysteine-containing dehydrogenase